MIKKIVGRNIQLVYCMKYIHLINNAPPPSSENYRISIVISIIFFNEENPVFNKNVAAPQWITKVS